MRKTWGTILGLAAVLLAGTAYTVTTTKEKTKEETPNTSITYTKDTEKAPDKGQKSEITVTPVSIDSEITTKQEAVYRMINAIDYYHSIEAQFTYTINPGEPAETIHLSAVNMPDDHLTQIETSSEKSNQTTMLYENGAIYSEKYTKKRRNLEQSTPSRPTVSQDENHAMTLEESITIGRDGVKSYKARPDLNNFSNAKIVALPSNLALSLLEDASLYEMTGTEMISVRNTVILEGAFSGSNQTTYQADHFKLNVDAKTGVLLGMKTIQNGQEKDFVKVDSVTFDQVPAAFQ